MTTEKTLLAATRRGLLLGAAASAGGAAASRLGMPFIGNAAAADPIKIGVILAKTGQIVDQAEYLWQGTELALEQRNKTLLDRPVELVWLDEPSPQVAQQNMQKLIDEHKVCAVIGGTLSSSALAMQAVAGRAKIPFVINNAAATDITGKNCNRWTFRLQPPVSVQMRALAPYAMGYGKKWYFLTAAYAFGQDILRSGRQILKEAGGTEVGSDEVPLNTPDYSSFILKIRAAKPDVVLGGIAAGDLTTFMKQWNELGMKGKIPFAEIAIGDTDIWGVGPQAATGTFTKMWYFNNPNNSPDDKAFAAAYMKKHNRPAADKAWMGWFAMKSLLGSIELAKSTEPEAIRGALEKWRYQDGDLAVGYRDFDHQMLLRTTIVETKANITDKWDYFDVKARLPEKVSDMEKVFGTKEEVGCNMAAT